MDDVKAQPQVVCARCGQLVPDNHKKQGLCQECYDVLELLKNPRANFDADAPVEIEFAFPNGSSLKRKMANPEEIVQRNKKTIFDAVVSAQHAASTLSPMQENQNQTFPEKLVMLDRQDTVIIDQKFKDVLSPYSSLEENAPQPIAKSPEQKTEEQETLSVEELKKMDLWQLSKRPWPKVIPDTLAKRHPHELDHTVRLDESNNRHDYYVQYEEGIEDKRNNLSTSTMIHEYFDDFVEMEGLEAVVTGKTWGPNHAKYGAFWSEDKCTLKKNLLALLKQWDLASEKGLAVGKFVHFLIECDLNEVLDLANHPVYSQKPQIQQYLKWKAEHFTPYLDAFRTEFRWRSCNKTRRVGTSDFLAVEKNHPPPEETGGILYVVDIDWKNTIIKNSAFQDRLTGLPKHGTGLCAHLDDCNLIHHTLQQEDYAFFPEQAMYGNWHYNGHVYKKLVFKCKVLVCFSEENPNNTYVMHDLNYLQPEIEQMWEKRAQDVAEWYKQNCPFVSKPRKTRPSEEQRSRELDVLLPQWQAQRKRFGKKLYLEPEEQLPTMRTNVPPIRPTSHTASLSKSLAAHLPCNTLKTTLSVQ